MEIPEFIGNVCPIQGCAAFCINHDADHFILHPLHVMHDANYEHELADRTRTYTLLHTCQRTHHSINHQCVNKEAGHCISTRLDLLSKAVTDVSICSLPF